MAKISTNISITEVEPVKSFLEGLLETLEAYETQGLLSAEDAMSNIDFLARQLYANINAEKVEDAKQSGSVLCDVPSCAHQSAGLCNFLKGRTGCSISNTEGRFCLAYICAEIEEEEKV